MCSVKVIVPPREGPARGATRPPRGWVAARAWEGPVGPREQAGLFRRVLASRPALLEPVALAVHFQEVDMTGDVVEHRADESVHDNTGKSSLDRRASAS